MNTQTLVLPIGPSANRYWRVFRNMVVVSAEAKAYKQQVKIIGLQQRVRSLGGPIAVTIKVFRPAKMRDLDNNLKVIMDALQGVLFDNDSQIVEIHAFRYDDKLNPRVEITSGIAEI